MLHTIKLSARSEETLAQIAAQGGTSADSILEKLAEKLLDSDSSQVQVQFNGSELVIQSIGETALGVRSTLGVMGGDACIRNTRIAVWQLVQLKQAGQTEDRLLANFPGLTASDLTAAWDFYAAHSAQVESERRAHEDAA